MKMQSIQYMEYGSPDVLQLVETEIPTVNDTDVLIKVRAVGVSSGDIRLRKADPFAVRFMFGLLKPKKPILGFAFAGEIAAVGQQTKKFKVGDQVFGTTGMKFGAYAEYVRVSENAVLAGMPNNMTYVEAAAVPFGGTTSLFFLRKGNIQPGQKVMIFGASGALGTAAVQLARHFGAEVTAVCSTANVGLVKSLGADRVIDYTKEDFTQRGEAYDIIFDTIGKSPILQTAKLLKGGGHYLRAVHMELSQIFQGVWTSMTTNKKVIGGVITETAADMQFLKGIIESGEFKAVVDKTYSLTEMQAAHRYVEGGHKKGNVVVTI